MERLELIKFYPMKNLLPSLLFFCLPVLTLSAQETYTLNSTFSTTENCDYTTCGIFVCWWDKEFDYADEAEALLNPFNGETDGNNAKIIYRDGALCPSVMEH